MTQPSSTLCMLIAQREKKKPVRELVERGQSGKRLGIVASLIFMGRKCFKKQNMIRVSKNTDRKW